jgi:hypothetical protein
LLRQKYKRKDEWSIQIASVLTLLTQTCRDVEYCDNQIETPVVLMSVVCKYQADTKSTAGNANSQPQAVAERCDVAMPCHVGAVG